MCSVTWPVKLFEMENEIMFMKRTIDTLASELLFVPQPSRDKLVRDSYMSLLSDTYFKIYCVERWSFERFTKAVNKAIKDIHVRIVVCG